MVTRGFRLVLLIASVAQLLLAGTYLLKIPFAVRLWPFPYTGDMSFIFVASILAAAAASTLWCVLSKEYGALTGIALDYLMIFTAISILAFQISADTGNNGLVQFGIGCVTGALFGLVLFLWSRRFPIRDSRPMPQLVRWSFVVFIAALLIVGSQMILKVPNILPWRISAVDSVIYGWMFIGAAAYFAYSLLRPSWHNSVGQLLGFLAYDVVLILPFLTRLPTIEPQWRLSLIIYTLVVSYSGVLAIYYLFISRQTRLFARREAVPVAG